jgi:hypothetical protein
MSKSPIQGQEYRRAFTLYSEDGKRAADVLEFSNGETYLDEQEWVEGTTFKNRHSGDSLRISNVAVCGAAPPERKGVSEAVRRSV